MAGWSRRRATLGRMKDSLTASVLTVPLIVILFGCAASADDHPIVIDGREGLQEWKAANVIPLANGGSILYRSSAGGVDLAVRTEENGWSHIYLFDGELIRILHASAALGTAEYVRSANGWRPVREFEWGARDASMSAEAVEVRRKHLLQQGWVASTTNMGEQGFLEFHLDQRLLSGSDIRIAVVSAASADAPHYWPETLGDATLAEELIYGNTPADLEFDPGQWARPPQ